MAAAAARNRYLKFVAYLQVISIILVVFGHSFHEYDANHGTDMLIYRMMFSFRMPVFTFVSGFLMVYTAKLPWRRYVGSKVLRLLLPYAVLSVLVLIPRYLLNFMADDDMELSVAALLYSDRLPIPFFWFLQMSFLLLSADYAVLRLAARSSRPLRAANAAFGLLLLLSLALIGFGVCGSDDFFAIKHAVRLWPYFLAGVLYCLNMTAVDSVVRWESPWVLAMAAAVWALAFFACPERGLGRVPCSMAGVVMCLSLARILARRGVRILDRLSGRSYAIFLLSWFVHVTTQQVLHYVTDFPWWVYTSLSFFGAIAVPCAFVAALDAGAGRGSRVARAVLFLLGQRRPKSFEMKNQKQ